ncbi:hypothetical protein [Indibacter alkaliphilus]|uniref:hypothetical protein n=1 Tax=Indibacter alkaliphilus TaxID=579922 RepID=UPI0002823315|nr:hypothetical protein [Indibacter alkaliphilus]
MHLLPGLQKIAPSPQPAKSGNNQYTVFQTVSIFHPKLQSQGLNGSTPFPVSFEVERSGKMSNFFEDIEAVAETKFLEEAKTG